VQPVLLEQPVVTHRGLVKYFRNTDLVYTATREVELAPEATFTVEQLQSERRIYDPFLIVSYGDESYYIEVWDESEFERQHT
jgi:hypothetical protein